MMAKFSISTGKKWRSQANTMTKRSKKASPVFLEYKLWQDKLKDFLGKEDSNLLPSDIPLCCC